MPYPKYIYRKGKEFPCKKCGKIFYRSPAQIAAGSIHHCSKKCLGDSLRGGTWIHPFFGKRHTTKTRSKISESRKGKALGNQNGKGYRHTNEARKKIADASRKMWARQRDKMLASLPRGENNIMWKGNARKYVREFTRRQKKEWMDASCRWCNNTTNLQLDHVLPVWFGNIRIRENAQTLCGPCNIWKHHFVERPMYHVFQAIKGTKS